MASEGITGVYLTGGELDKLADGLAEKTAEKIAQGILRMPDELRAAVADANKHQNNGYFSAPAILMPGPNAYTLQAYVRSGGIQLEIRDPMGATVWRAVII